MKQKSTERFSDRVDNYVKYRPGYPDQVITHLRAEGILTETVVIADIGSGTGLLSALFLEQGNQVIGVEPNANMRHAAEVQLAHYANFSSVNGTAESTSLPSSSVDLITVGQALHWFDAVQAHREFVRILRPSGYTAVIWNIRNTKAAPFMQAFEALMAQYGSEYKEHHHSQHQDKHDVIFFEGMQLFTCANAQRLDFSGLQGRALSSSYAPLPPNSRYAPFIAALRNLYESFQDNGQVTIHYQTQMYYGRLEENYASANHVN